MFGEWDKSDLATVATSAGIFLGTWCGLIVVKFALWKKLKRFVDKTPQKWDDELLKALAVPSHFLIFFLAVGAGLYPFPNRLETLPSIIPVTKVIFVLLGSWILDRILGVLIRFVVFPDKMTEEGRAFAIVIVRGVFISVVLLAVLDTLGISITPFLASLGIGSIAVALALQDTLGNLFSGFYVLVDKPVRVGDYIKLNEGVEGFVRKIGWRSTRLELLSANMVVIPNSKLSSAIVTNFNLPVSDCELVIEVPISYESDPDQVEKVIREVADDLQKRSTFAVNAHQPVLRFHSFAESSICLNVTLRAKTYPDTSPLRHEFIGELYRRFKREQIRIPYPHRVVRNS